MEHKNNNKGFSIKELLSKEEILSVWQYKCHLERRQSRIDRRKNKKIHNAAK